MYIESKYIANASQKVFIKNFLDFHYKNSDPYPVDIVSNLYFDTMDLRSSKEAFSDKNHKRKFRLRLYKSTELYSLQIKTKNNMSTSKIKASLLPVVGIDPFSLGRWEDLFSCIKDSDGARNELIQTTSDWGSLYPLVHIQYTRYRYRVGDTRVTWDDNLQFKSSSYFAFGHVIAKPTYGILEMKSVHGVTPDFVKSGLGLNLLKTNFSKLKNSLMDLQILHPPIVDFERKYYGPQSAI